MNVILNLLGEIVVDDIHDILHVQPSTGHIRGNKDQATALLELIQSPVTLLLSLVTMNGQGGHALGSQSALKLISASLSVSEHNHLAGRVHDGLEQSLELLGLLGFLANNHMLRNLLVCLLTSGTHGDLNRLLLAEVSGKGRHLFRPGGRVKHGLSVRSDLGNNLANLRLETHIQHSIGFVQSQVSHTSQIGLGSVGTLGHEIDKTAGSGNHDLSTVSQVSGLLALGDTAVTAGSSDTSAADELVGLSENLASQLSGGSENQSDGSVAALESRLSLDVDNRRENESQSLTRTGLRQTNQVHTRQGNGDTLHLDGGGGREAQTLNNLRDGLGKLHLCEQTDRLGDLGVTRKNDVVLSSHFFDFLVSEFGNVGVLSIEVLLKRHNL